jgi:UDP-N-acetylglucosamine 2-epimerase (non-hydrolysing)
MVLVQGDTTTTFATSLAAFYHRIPVGHIEAGLRTEDKYQPFPEEVNRLLTSHIADLHFAPTPWASHNLMKEGVDPKRIFVTGNTVIDAMLHVVGRIRKTHFQPRLLKELDLQHGKMILVTAHRRENFGQLLINICDALKEISKRTDEVDLVFPVHLNPNIKKIVDARLSGIDNVHLLEPMDYVSFIYLMDRSYLILTDSGGIQEEAPSLGKPVLVMRNVSERPEGIEAGVVKLVGTDKETILEHVERLLCDQDAYQEMSQKKNPYGDGKSAERIVRVIRDLPLSKR